MPPLPGSLHELNGVRVYQIPPHGPELRSARDAVDIMSEAAGHNAGFIAIPVARLGDDFFNLRTGIAGDILQKFATYGKRVAIVGDISSRTAASRSLAALVVESNRGRGTCFVESLQELAERLP